MNEKASVGEEKSESGDKKPAKGILHCLSCFVNTADCLSIRSTRRSGRRTRAATADTDSLLPSLTY